jgi:HAD superfamily hydrolase (TIGR01549 family)
MTTTRGVIFDLDGTLVDTNGAHIEAWLGALAEAGFPVTRERFLPEVGKGGDLLLPSVLGEHEAERSGKRVSEMHGERFLAIARARRFAVFDGAVDLVRELRRRDVPMAIATSSDERYAAATARSAGVDFRALVDEATTRDDAAASKPEPDIVLAAVARLGVPANECVMIGDTPHDGVAARRAGVAFQGVLCGGTSSRAELCAAGALAVWRDPRDLLDHLDEALRLEHGRR